MVRPPGRLAAGFVALLALALAGASHARADEVAIELAGPFLRDAGLAWLASVPAVWASDDEQADCSALVLHEDDRPLGPAHAVHDEIRRLGKGRFSHWKGALYFSTSDGSNPNDNGRRYTIALAAAAEGPMPAAVAEGPMPAFVAEGPMPASVAAPGRERWRITPPADVLAAFGPEGPARDRPPRARRPDAPRLVYWYTIDALRADTARERLPDGPLMPHLDAFRRQAVDFGRAYASSSFTKTSTASMFTGLHPGRHGVLHGVVPGWPDGALLAFDLDRRFLTLAELLASYGYATATHLYTVHVRPGDGMLQGFLRTDLATGQDAPLPELPARAFVYEHILGLHAPYDPSPDARQRLGLAAAPDGSAVGGSAVGDEQGAPGAMTDRTHPSTAGVLDPASTEWFYRPLDGAQVATLRDEYRAEGIDADEQLGRRLQWLRAAGLFDAALIIVTADHGEEFGEHGATQHSVQLYEEVVRVPLLVKFPAGHPLAEHHGRAFDHRVSLVDLYPTIVELVAGDLADVPYALDGASLQPILAGDEPEHPPRDVLLRTSFTRSLEDGAGAALFVTDAVLSGRLKAHLGYRIQGTQLEGYRPCRQGSWIGELYDLSSDAAERSDLAAGNPELLERLAARLLASQAPLQPANAATDGAPPNASDDELLERLRAMGYVR